MYKLLLVTDREEVKEAFLNVEDWGKMMFFPVTILENVQEAVRYLDGHAVDAIGYSLMHEDASPLQQYISDHPSLPVFQTHRHDKSLQEELRRISRFLDRMHADDSDEGIDENDALQILRDELMQALISGEIQSRDELLGRIKLVRANVAAQRRCYVFDFDLPQGEVYLSDRWHYGRDRLQSALRNNFFGRYVDDVYYDVAVMTPRHIRLFACPRMNIEKDDRAVQRQVKAHVRKAVEGIKQYLDLDLDLENCAGLKDIFAMIDYKE